MASDGFAQMIDEANTFFVALEANNTRDWFDPRKADYATIVKKPAELFSELLAEEFSRISGVGHKPKLFRVYRDVRFSKDKRPYNAHLHILWTPVSGGPFAPAFFFASSPTDLSVGFGVPSLAGGDLQRFRAFVDAQGDMLVQAMTDTGLALSDWGPAALKRVPKPYGADHPQGDLLKRKNLLVSGPLGQAWRGSEEGLLGAVRDRFAQCLPLAKVLREV